MSHINLPSAIAELIKPIFKELSDPKILEKCMHGQTQNCNESINATIWQRCPKETYVSKQTLETGVASAVIHCNDGNRGLQNGLKALKLDVGPYTQSSLMKSDKHWVKRMNHKTTPAEKNKRKVLRHIRKGFQDDNLEAEGEKYISGGF